MNDGCRLSAGGDNGGQQRVDKMGESGRGWDFFDGLDFGVSQIVRAHEKERTARLDLPEKEERGH